MIEPETLKARVEDALKVTHLSPSQFGRQAVNDPNLVKDLREGRELRKKTRERVLTFIERIQSEDAA